jgi:hypothetical protein
MKFEFEWEEAPGVRDEVLAATWARLDLKVGDAYASEAINVRSRSRQTSIYGSLFPLAEWLVENWWHLLYEPPPRFPVPGGRPALPAMRGWVQRHNLLVARDGGALPDLTIARDGSDIILQWDADPVTDAGSRLRFVGRGSEWVTAADFEESIQHVVEAVLARVSERLDGKEVVERMIEAWTAIRDADADPAEKALCRSLAILGVDPYDPDEATNALVEVVRRSLADLPEDLHTDLFEGSDPGSLSADLDWIEKSREELLPVVNGGDFPTIEPAPTSLPPHDAGYLAARRVRSEILSLPADEPIPDLLSAFTARLGWAADCTRSAPGQTRLDGLVGLDVADSAPVLVISSARSKPGERFRLARAAYFPVTRNLGRSARLLSGSATPPQRASRAFAAELLAPAAALKKRVFGRLSDHDLEELAQEFFVSSQVITHQIENHGLGYVEA